MDSDFDTLRQLVVTAVEALALLGIALVCLTRIASGAWAPIGLFGGILAAISPAVSFAALLQLRLSDSYSILTAVTDGGPLSTGLLYTSPVGLVLVAVAFALAAGRRGPATRAPYGPPGYRGPDQR